MSVAAFPLARAETLLRARSAQLALAAFCDAEQAGADPDSCAGGRWQCSMLLGDYEAAWRESDAIRERGKPDPHRVWDGQSLRGKRVLIRSVHGFGDAVQMLRFVPRLHAAEVTVQAAPELCELLRLLPGVDHCVPWGEEPEFDAQVEVNELGYCVRATVADVGREVPYLAVAPAELGPRERPRVGLVWTASTWSPSRSMPFGCLAPLLAQGGVEFWSLQAAENNREWQEHSVARSLPLRVGGERHVLWLAAHIAAMDYVITVDTFAAHLAGATNTPAAVLLEREADWRWMLDRDDSPWYPSLRLLRQKQQGDWRAPVEQACALLEPLR